MGIKMDKEINKLLDRAKAAVFMSQEKSAFLSSIMCSLKFVWSEEVPTAGVDGFNLFFNRDFFTQASPEFRKTLLLHEIWHVARMHHLRMGDRDPEVWNIACDVIINVGLYNEGYSFEGQEDTIKECLKLHKPDMTEEELYDILMDGKKPNASSTTFSMQGKPSDGDSGTEEQGASPSPEKMEGNDKGDILAIPEEEDKNDLITNVIQATQQAKLSGSDYGSGLGDIDGMIEEYLKPKVKWSNILNRFFHDTLPSEDTNWNKRNRRFRNIYLPSDTLDKEVLSHLIYYIDVSGSVSDDQVQQFASEVNYVHGTFKPDKITIIPFDDGIREPIHINAYDKFPKLEFTGRGGTSLAPVREHILEMKPTAAIIFSDMYCRPMQHVGVVPLVWIVMDNPNAVIDEGIVVHID